MAFVPVLIDIEPTPDTFRVQAQKINTNLEALPAAIATAGIQYVTVTVDGGGNAIDPEAIDQPWWIAPFAGTIQEVILLADQVGSVQFDIWKDTYANYPPTDADSICGTAEPAIVSDIKMTDSTLTGWTTTIAAGDVLMFCVDSCTTIERVTLTLKIAIS